MTRKKKATKNAKVAADKEDLADTRSEVDVAVEEPVLEEADSSSEQSIEILDVATVIAERDE